MAAGAFLTPVARLLLNRDMKMTLQPREFPVKISNSLKVLCLILPLACFSLGPATAAKLKEARVTQVIKDVRLLPKTAAPRPATVSKV